MKSVYRLRTAANRSDLMVDIKARKIEKHIQTEENLQPR